MNDGILSYMVVERKEEEEKSSHQGETTALSYHLNSASKLLYAADTETEEETLL